MNQIVEHGKVTRGYLAFTLGLTRSRQAVGLNQARRADWGRFSEHSAAKAGMQKVTSSPRETASPSLRERTPGADLADGAWSQRQAHDLARRQVSGRNSQSRGLPETAEKAGEGKLTKVPSRASKCKI